MLLKTGVGNEKSGKTFSMVVNIFATQRKPALP